MRMERGRVPFDRLFFLSLVQSKLEMYDFSFSRYDVHPNPSGLGIHALTINMHLNLLITPHTLLLFASQDQLLEYCLKKPQAASPAQLGSVSFWALAFRGVWRPGKFLGILPFPSFLVSDRRGPVSLLSQRNKKEILSRRKRERPPPCPD